MSSSLNSLRSNRPLRAVGLAVAIASLATACGTTTSSPATEAGAAMLDTTGLADSELLAAAPAAIVPGVENATVNTDAEQGTNPDVPQGSPESVPQSQPDPEPQLDPGQELDQQSQADPDPSPATNVAPVLDVVRVTRRGGNVTVGINASDADGDDLSLSVSGVLGAGGESFDHASASDSGIFEFPFSPDARGIVTLTTSVSDGHETTQQVDQIEIAPLQVVTMGPAEVVVSKGCFIENDKLTFHPASPLMLLDTRGVSSNKFTDVVANPITLDLHNTGSQLFVTALSAEFEENSGFAAEFGLRGTFGDIDVHFSSGKVQPGRYQSPNFVSPGDPRCWLTVGYVIAVQQAV